MTDLTIRHHVPKDHYAARWYACVWCGGLTDILAETPFRPDIGALPLMLTCGAHMRQVYRRMQDGGLIDQWEMKAVLRLMQLPRLGDGT